MESLTTNTHSNIINTSNIKYYLTPKSKPYYTKVIEIVEYLKTIAFYDKSSSFFGSSTKLEIHIFGGFVRNIISHYFNPTEDFVPSADVDIWFDYSQYRTHSYNSWRRHCVKMFGDLKQKYDVGNECLISNELGPRETYGLCKLTIDGIKFDFNTDINGESTYSSLADFSVNNLSINTEGNLSKRVNECCDYSLEELIEHIKDKKLINILDVKQVMKYIEWGYLNEETRQIKFHQRITKMISYGYKNNYLRQISEAA